MAKAFEFGGVENSGQILKNLNKSYTGIRGTQRNIKNPKKIKLFSCTHFFQRLSSFLSLKLLRNADIIFNNLLLNLS